MDEIPVMLSTVLGLNMLLQEHCIDLQSVSELILNDVGATIKILQLVGEEYDMSGVHPCRMGDCIASLDVHVWFGAISSRTFSSDLEHSAMSEFWEHSRLVAQYAQLIAESSDDVSPEDAYLVGLLHGVETLPAVLGWPGHGRGETVYDALTAIEAALPPFVLTSMHELADPDHPSPWSGLLTAAHELSHLRLRYLCSSVQQSNPNGHPGAPEEMLGAESRMASRS